MIIEKEVENGKQVKSKVEQCMTEVEEILTKHNCRIICQKQEMYGQIIYVPSIVEIKK